LFETIILPLINHKIKNMEIHIIAKQCNNVCSLPSVYAIDEEICQTLANERDA
ncbi:hypothetical protein T08_4667, partial [Trichinella sp. T8]